MKPKKKKKPNKAWQAKDHQRVKHSTCENKILRRVQEDLERKVEKKGPNM